jgi:hypothetical protein
MGQRSRKKRRTAEAPHSRPAPAPDALRRGYARAEERNQAIREELEPLGPGERPGAVTVAAIVALGLAVANTVALILGKSLEQDATTSSVAFSIILLVAAAGMWKAKYWAVLGFEALLGIQVALSAIAAMLAGTWLEALVLTAATFLGGWLFWKLVRSMARLQMPER